MTKYYQIVKWDYKCEKLYTINTFDSLVNTKPFHIFNLPHHELSPDPPTMDINLCVDKHVACVLPFVMAQFSTHSTVQQCEQLTMYFSLIFKYRFPFL